MRMASAAPTGRREPAHSCEQTAEDTNTPPRHDQRGVIWTFHVILWKIFICQNLINLVRVFFNTTPEYRVRATCT